MLVAFTRVFFSLSVVCVCVFFFKFFTAEIVYGRSAQDSTSNYSGTDAPLIYPTGCGGAGREVKRRRRRYNGKNICIRIFHDAKWSLPRTFLFIRPIDRVFYSYAFTVSFWRQTDRNNGTRSGKVRHNRLRRTARPPPNVVFLRSLLHETYPIRTEITVQPVRTRIRSYRTIYTYCTMYANHS